MYCANCSGMKIVSIEDGCGASAKCFLTSKRGKSITWAMTTVDMSNSQVSELGHDRVVKVLNSNKAVPFWCPLKKKNK